MQRAERRSLFGPSACLLGARCFPLGNCPASPTLIAPLSSLPVWMRSVTWIACLFGAFLGHSIPPIRYIRAPARNVFAFTPPPVIYSNMLEIGGKHWCVVTVASLVPPPPQNTPTPWLPSVSACMSAYSCVFEVAGHRSSFRQRPLRPIVLSLDDTAALIWHGTDKRVRRGRRLA